MSCNDKTKFLKVDHIGSTLLNNQLETNLKTFLDWGLLSIGAWSNVNIPTSGAFGGTFDTLRPVRDPSYTNGQVWESARKDWVWETGMDYSGILADGTLTGVEPINITGVMINGTMYGTGHATYAHHYNYPLGRVIFDNPVPVTSVVRVPHSYRNVQVYISDHAPWWDELQQNSMRVDDPTFSSADSGNWNILANHRVQLPAVVIEAVPRRTFMPYQMGDLSQFVYQDVLFHVIGDTRWWRNQLVDIISFQKDSQVYMYDNDLLIQSGVYPLDYRGMVIDKSKTYPVLSTDYRDKMIRFYNVIVTEMESINSRLYLGTIRVTFELIHS